MLDYSTLKIIWWLLVGVLLIGFAIMDGHDMGVGTLLPFVGRNDLLVLPLKDVSIHRYLSPFPDGSLRFLVVLMLIQVHIITLTMFR